ncbi:hypothetical protein DSO57_1035205 [Entomophthora muscae]|uniref:Uncharacterized protein n=1 Tax=Entomophthora muscae TaxID=34485 RepID=A0ACC2UKA2_9FUNG|nr:hypothetical protein DSO57_1035205 [Entomophthora muscae]
MDLVVSKFPPIDKNSHSANHCLADCPMRLLFLPPYSLFLNPIQEVFGWIKNKVKEGLPQDTKDLFNILEVSQFEMPPDVVESFYEHSKSFLPKALASEPICQGPDCPGQSAGLTRGEETHSLGTHTKYLPVQENPLSTIKWPRI